MKGMNAHCTQSITMNSRLKILRLLVQVMNYIKSGQDEGAKIAIGVSPTQRLPLILPWSTAYTNYRLAILTSIIRYAQSRVAQVHRDSLHLSEVQGGLVTCASGCRRQAKGQRRLLHRTNHLLRFHSPHYTAETPSIAPWHLRIRPCV